MRLAASGLSGWLSTLVLALLCPSTSRAATLSIESTGPDTARLRVAQDPSLYYRIQQSTDLRQFTVFAMVLGENQTSWDLYIDPELPARFFRSSALSVFAPGDYDDDGIDDVYEIRHPVLNPLDPSDAALDPDGNGMTYLQEYRAALALGTSAREVYSREVSTFNFGAPIEAAISREVSIYNFGAPLAATEAISREVSVFNGEGGEALADTIREVYSREISTYNFGAPLAAIEALSRELSVFNGEAGPALGGDLREVYSREVSTFNFGAPISPTEAISREVSVFNNVP
jgi:hypothetical protein